MHKKVVIFGEMLWDCFSDKNIPGGAPMNVALHIQYLGYDTTFISKVGKDQLGIDLLDFVQSKSLDIGMIQKDESHETSRVVVDDSDKENIKYEIVKPVAWDFISWNQEVQKRVNEADAFVFGSLAARSKESSETLLKLLETHTLKILDINIRAPHYSFDLIESLLMKADILKINDDELMILKEELELSNDIEKAITTLAQNYKLKLVCVTLGSKGAMIYDGKQLHRHPGYKVIVEDTVGSGDAFLSGFIHQFLQNKPANEILDFACALGALVATNKGGTPQYDLKSIDNIRKSYSS
ncbi:carbohydrate kinase [Echinicola sp. CAU 1574]|uniref:Carbohydrate kinase n=1 Tax=Echinicola arenosa TaxID=2774144 RepID=A0ABR9AEM7_9BACT|nr:carbohydrate kinase [Echinicola arenosa]MBD8487230.1 carbohydrate kinase [Echinicola arenosa]